MLHEIDYYTHIIDRFVDFANNLNTSELWKDHLIIELMEILKENHDKTFVTNSLITLLALFEDYLKDSYFYLSEDVKNISETDKHIFIETLKEATMQL